MSASIVDIVKYPWASIYTTNYDNGLELAFHSASKKSTPINNIDNPNAEYTGTQIVHLHGFADAWSNENFDRSCILDADSYRSLPGVRDWLDYLRFDIERASIVVFIGFRAADFHLEQVFFNSTGLKEKAFFINHPSASPDPDERAYQEDFGIPLYIGREQFAEIITEIVQLEAPREPSLASFRRFSAPKPSDAVPPTSDIEDLFIWGKVVPAHIKRDLDLSASDYHVLRHDVNEIYKQLLLARRIMLLYGDICEGKTLSILGAMIGLSGSRPVFNLHHPYADLLDEVSSVLSVYPNATFVVENCFSLHEDRLMGLVRQVAASEGSLILSARSISTDAESSKLKGLRGISTFSEMEIGRLSPPETDALINLIDQIAGWRKFRALSHSDRRRFIETECRAAIPSALLHLLSSEYVRNIYREEFQKTSDLNPRERSMVIAALLISNVGFDAPLSLISDLFESDFSSILERLAMQKGRLRLVRAVDGVAQTVPSVGARNLLRHVIDDRDIVNSTIHILEMLATDVRRSDLHQHIFSQMMRYSILSSVVTELDEVNRFFDHISKIPYFRSMPLFWLQWHMAMCFQERWLDAEKYLEMGYTAADAYDKKRCEKFNRRQLDDRRAKFLAARALSTKRSDVELYRDLKGALDIVWRLMRDPALTHHPFETLLDVVKAMEGGGCTIIDVHRDILNQQLTSLVSHAKARLDLVPIGYQRNHATGALNDVSAVMPALLR